MRTLLSAAFVAAFFVSGCTNINRTTTTVSAECRQNLEWTEWKQKLGLNRPLPLPPRAHDVFIDAFNISTPVSNYHPEHVFLIQDKTRTQIFVFFVDGPCVSLIFPMTKAEFMALMAPPGRGV